MAAKILPGLAEANGHIVYDPLLQYKINDIENGVIKYYGFTDVYGSWYILKISNSGTTSRYARGGSGYSTAWENRASLGYDYFDALF